MKTPVCTICVKPYDAVFERTLKDSTVQRTRSPIVSAYLENGSRIYMHKICMNQTPSKWANIMQNTTRKQRREAIKNIFAKKITPTQ